MHFMPSRGLHPAFRRLHRFMDDEVAKRERTRIANHLIRCSRCRSYITSARRLMADAQSLAAPVATPELLARILRDRDRSEAVILPSAPTVARTGPARVWIPVGLVAALLLAFVFWRRSPATLLPTLGDDLGHGLLAIAVPRDAAAATPSEIARPLTGIDGRAVRPMRIELELTRYGAGQRVISRERGWLQIDSARYQGVQAWTVTSRWLGHTTDADEVTTVSRDGLEPLTRSARNIGPSMFTIEQRFIGDSVSGSMVSRAQSHKLARRLPTNAAPFIPGEALVPLLLQSVHITPEWHGTASLVGWTAMPSDIVYPVSIETTGDALVTVPAGIFDCWQLRLRSGAAFQFLWVRKSDQLIVLSRDADLRHRANQQTALLSVQVGIR